jgi:hypothetical protein
VAGSYGSLTYDSVPLLLTVLLVRHLRPSFVMTSATHVRPVSTPFSSLR